MFETLESRTLLSAVKIMPLGDSITEGNPDHPTYRYYLWKQLQAAGYDSSEVDFIGSKTGTRNGTPPFPDFDQDYEAYTGALSEYIAHQVYYAAQEEAPDIVLMHIGTNDAIQDWSASGTMNWIKHAISNIRTFNPNVTILVAKLIPNNVALENVQAINAAIPGMIAQTSTSQSKVIAVDQYSGFSVPTDTFDGVHPDSSGDQKIATKWFNALSPLLGGSTPPPDPDPTAPAAPTAVKANASKSYMNLTWWDKSDNEDKFVIERKTWSNGQWETIGEAPANFSKFTDATNLKAGVKYYYRVSAVNEQGKGVSSPPTLATPLQTNKYVYASDMPWSSWKNSLGPVERDQSNGGSGTGDGDSLNINGTTYSKGIGSYGDSSVLIRLDGDFSRFTSEIGIDDAAGGDSGSVQFKIYADGKKVFSSGTVSGSSAPRKVDIDLEGVQELYLIVSSAGDGTSNDYGVWGKALLTV